MALITCIECGKKFSDKAEACPECGCPTSVILGTEGEQKKAEIVVQLDKSSEEASKQMYDAVAHAKRVASSADSDFDFANSRIQIKASSRIDLFGGTAVSEVADIAQDAKKACDDLYAALQLAVATLDSECRPLLIYKPEGKAIKEVYEEIKQLNSDSEISNTFSATVNYDRLGDVATRRYSPSIQAKMVEQFWRNEYEKIRSEMNRIEAEKKAKEAEIQKKIAEEKRIKLEKFQNENKAIIEEYASKAKRSITLLTNLEKQAFEKKKTEVTNKIQEEKTKVQASINQKIDTKISNIKVNQGQLDSEYMSDVTAKRNYIDEKEAALAKLKMFDFAKKKALGSEVETLVNQLQKVTEHYKSQTSQYKKEIETLQNEKNASIKKEFEAIDKRHPLPQLVEYKKEVVSVPKPMFEKTPTQIANEGIKEAIYEYLLTVDWVNLTDIMQNCLAVADLSNQRVSALVRQLVTDGNVERKEEKRLAFFRAVEGYSTNSSKKNQVNTKKSNPVALVESLIKEKTMTLKQLQGYKPKDMDPLEDYEIYGALKYLAIDHKIYVEEKDYDSNIFYIPEEYRKTN